MSGYQYRFDGVREIKGPNYTAQRADVSVSRGTTQLPTLHPEKRVYNVQSMPMTEAAIDTGPFGDRYVSLGEPVGGTAWTLRIYKKPFVTWIWGGCALMALGGVLAVLDRRYRTQAVRDARAALQSAKA